MAEHAQTYANHVYRATAWTVTGSVALIVLLTLAFYAWQEPTAVSVALVALAGVVVSALWLVRVFALRLQNRIIRLEMQVRLARLGREQDLPAAHDAANGRAALRVGRRTAGADRPDDRGTPAG